MTLCQATFAPMVDSEPIPGYVLKQRIASGGFGEVWKAEAPGGLAKAVKFVYGTLDESLAIQELKSLTRIKEVHHPFLLSLERIEVVDGHLMIVSELADGCLMDRFQNCRASGLTGIPRDELLGYLRDAAEVLDYLYEKYSLQHLDVKPQNLLLVGNHVKVGDFGLLKNLQEVNVSVMGGLTPLYSPPEVLLGHPSRHSDQYSLAIVFQEMLSGEPPFAGRTTAQLAAQHLHSPPALHALPPTDQPVIARALAKKPEARFPSCRAFIESLSSPSKPAPAVRRAISHAAGSAGAVDKTIPLDGALDCLNEGAALIARLQPKPKQQVDLDPIPLTPNYNSYRPTLFIGVGGLAARVLPNLRRRLVASFASGLSEVPAVQMLLIDTHSKTLADTMLGELDTALPARETFCIPLRPAHDYRGDSQSLLGWIGRRWLYNVPRSLQTEGLRPYGRLAFVDHSRAIYARLQKMLTEITSKEAISASAQATGLPFCGPLQIVIVASTAGGAGSGIVLDLAYAVRKQLRELNISDEQICGVLVHGAPRQGAQRELAVPNTCACLSELRQYSEAGGHYPGDPSCNLPAYWDNNETFHHTYFVDLGEESSDAEFDTATNNLADYLWLSTATPAVEFFDQSRKMERDQYGNSLSSHRIRTVGVVRFPASIQRFKSGLEATLCRGLVQSWLESTTPVPQRKQATTEAQALTAQFAERLGIRLESFVSEATRQLHDQAQQTPEQYAHARMSRLVGESVSNDASADLLSKFDQQLVADPPGTDADQNSGADPSDEPLTSRLHASFRKIADDAGTSITDWIFYLVDRPSVRLHGARSAAKWLAEQLENVYVQARTKVEALETEIGILSGKIHSNSKIGQTNNDRISDSQSAALKQYAELRVKQTVYRCAQSAAASMIRPLHSAVNKLQMLGRSVQELLHLFPQQDASVSILTGSDERLLENAKTASSGQSVVGDTIAKTDRALSGELAELSLSFVRLLQDAAGREQLDGFIRKAASHVAEQYLAASQSENDESSRQDVLSSFAEQLKLATPSLFDCGGSRRLLLIAPMDSNLSQLQREILSQFSKPATICLLETKDIILCCEVESVPLDNILLELLARQTDCVDALRRLHARIDIPWMI